MGAAFEGRRVIVTGGTGGLGSAVVETLLAQGARVRIPAFSAKEVEAFALRAHERVEIVPEINLSTIEGVERAYSGVSDLWASVHVAGGFGMGPITADDQPGLFDRLVAMNIKTSFLCCRAAASVMTASGRGGRIVNVAARPAVCPREGRNMSVYTLTKAAVAALTEALSVELAAAGIWVNAVAPSVMDTPPNRAAMPGADYGSWPKVHEVAATVAFLASADNAVTTGGVVPVYGRC